MRLQVSIHRHMLPDVNIIFATGTGPASHTTSNSATIFNLLEDLNNLVPLESPEKWGLEDYVVEVAARSEQQSAYECLHYLPISSVLREDDEVIVRPLLSDDLRAWRRGGRMQITEDGRHLIDGVVFSKPWVRQGRPDFDIPPRKRQKTLEDDQNSEKENVEPQELGFPALMAPQDDEDDDDDEDYISENDADEQAVVTHGVFEDADASEDEDDGDDVDLGSEEMQLLLEDAEKLDDAEDAEDLLETRLNTRSKLGKRKRHHADDEDEIQGSQEPVFEGFTSPVRTRVLQDVSNKFVGSDDDEEASDSDSMMEEISTTQAKKKAANQVGSDEDETPDDEDYSNQSSSSVSVADETEGEAAKGKSLKKMAQGKPSQASYEDASSDESSQSDDASSSSDSSDTESNSDSSSGSSSDSESITSPVSEAESERSQNPEARGQVTTPQHGPTIASKAASSGRSATEKRSKTVETPPGKGSHRTHHNNNRVKRRKRLEALKRSGELPQDANFADLDEYDGSYRDEDSTLIEAGENLEAARRKALAQFQTANDHQAKLDDTIATSVEVPEEDEQRSPIVPETQEGRDRGHELDAIHLPQIPAELTEQMLQLEDPERARLWLRSCFAESPESSVSQNAMYVAYYACFGKHGALLGSEFLPCILEVFSGATVEDPFDPYTSIKGISPRDTVDDLQDSSFTDKQPQQASTINQTLSETVAATSSKSATSKSDGAASASVEPSPKRAQLDVSASRRLIFGALGSRNPKTPAQEKAVREKLSGNVRKPLQKPDSATVIVQPTTEDDSDDGSWKRKLLITAVECEKEGVVYPPPPFPFVQHWHKNGKASRQPVESDRPSTPSRGASSSNSNLEEVKPVGPEAQEAESVVSNVESRTVSFEKDEQDAMPIPSDFGALVDLDRSHLLPGTIIGFKQLEIDMGSFTPHESTYKVAKVDRVEDDTIAMVLATKYRIQTAGSEDDSAEGEKTYNNFVIREDGEEDDGFRELDYSAFIEPKLIEASRVQVPASAAGKGDNSTAEAPQTQEDTFAVSESVPKAADPTAPVSRVSSQVEIDTPRRAEISAVIKDAGFNSSVQKLKLDPALDSQTRTSSQQVFNSDQPSQWPAHQDQSAAEIAETSGILPEPRSSSPFFPREEETNIRERAGKSQLTSQAPPATSSPPLSPRLTVEYPDIHMDLDSDLPEQNVSRNSSSHQDAQRLSPPPGADTTILASEQRRQIETIIENSADIMGSDLPKPETEDVDDGKVISDHDSDGEPLPKKNTLFSRLGLGLDGNESSYHESDDEDSSDSEDDIPSLRDLTSSQKRKIMTRASRTTKAKSTRSSSPRAKEQRNLRSASAAKHRTGVDHDEKMDEPLLPQIKVSASQREAENGSFSQIPAGTQVVDLTQSSDPVSPGNSDGELELRASKNRTKRNGITSRGRNTRSVTTGTSSLDIGLGQRRFLTTKKTRNYV
ncbi:uncharacterized protein HMPREF1541_02121 [Cyphellophora europaea CBS 101466]|uniref:DUF7357 domain-containing protein n=1 Tax=Cyphellophora europaea (strain CBS 101466) TaxID=1220924 RepID=W2S4J2_CYPE1|nr:uncharacterized protein HMPREF1541_02121 [Cyphellophora europaea CBS 101466]ETN42963.1 hypothetical protein HMPREF1541_02121 [Cyphellophora europaea CBS 101466]